MKASVPRGATVVVPAPEGAATLRVAYFFSGAKRKGSVADCLKKLCVACGAGLHMEEIDIMVGGSSHDLLNQEAQEEYLGRMEGGEFDFVLFSPPCGTWSRANWANNNGPSPCRDRRNPWGLPHQLFRQRRRAKAGNAFIHFTLRGIGAITTANRLKGGRCRALWEHPEDLGRMFSGTPASVWQLPETRALFPDGDGISVAGHQCQYAGIDRKKPTRLLGNIPGLEQFGYVGWPRFDSQDYYCGPLPKSCGHDHRQRMIGRTAQGEFHNRQLHRTLKRCACGFQGW